MNANRAGYSLFEVLIAFAIMSMMLAVLIPGQARVFARSADADTRFLATDYALSVLEEIGVSQPLQIGEVQQTFDDWRVLITANETTLSDDTQMPVQHITVQILSSGGQSLAEISTVRPVR